MKETKICDSSTVEVQKVMQMQSDAAESGRERESLLHL